MIIDEARIYLKAGDGGIGCLSTARVSRKTMGDGGNGGDGGNIILRIGFHPYDLSRFKGNKKFVAENGKNGDSNNKSGKNGRDIVLELPEGTIVKDWNGEMLVDLTGNSREFLICRGGKSGEGNYKKTYTLPPQPGEEKEVILDYRIPADVAIVGFANSGKTALVNKLTGKDFKVADYPFTTQSCVWAKCQCNFREFTIMDMPALKKTQFPGGENANTFLKHLYRPRVVLFLSDNHSNYFEEFSMLKSIITGFDHSFLKNKKLFYLLTKIDKIDKTTDMGRIIPLSVVNDLGIEKLKKAMLKVFG